MTTKPAIETGSGPVAVASETSGSEEARSVERSLSPAAQRALAEAEARRLAQTRDTAEAEKEIGGRGGRDPARYGDWEIDGRAIDF